MRKRKGGGGGAGRSFSSSLSTRRELKKGEGGEGWGGGTGCIREIIRSFQKRPAARAKGKEMNRKTGRLWGREKSNTKSLENEAHKKG